MPITKESIINLMNGSRYDIVKHKIMSDFFGSDEYRKQASKSKWVEDVKKEQRNDGSWGRFHTQDSRLKQKYRTTESAVLRLQYLSLKRGDDIVDKACGYMERLLRDVSMWPDAWERNIWFKPAVPLFIASKLAMFGSDCHEYISECEKWICILIASFENGEYNAKTTDSFTTERIGVPIDASYIGLSTINNVLLFSCNVHMIPANIQKLYIKWLHHHPAAIGYTLASLSRKPETLKGNELYDYIRIMSLLLVFDGYANEFSQEISWLENQCDGDGYWDFGIHANKGLKLSDSWRSEVNRKIDCSVFALSALKMVIV